MEKTYSLTGFGLKRIAVTSMVIDHIGSFLLGAMLLPYKTGGTLVVDQSSPISLWRIMQAKELCDMLGRAAFPIFCFLMVEGFLHTRDRVGYGLRMGLFALISEIPYDLVQFHTPFSLRLQNVMFTLTVGIFTLLAVSKAEERWRDHPGPRWASIAALTAAGMGLPCWSGASMCSWGSCRQCWFICCGPEDVSGWRAWPPSWWCPPGPF